MAVALIVPTRRLISRPLLDLARARRQARGASGSLSPPRRACPQEIGQVAAIPPAPRRISNSSRPSVARRVEACSAGPASMSMGSCDDSHHLISGSSVMACHSAACTDDRAEKDGAHLHNGRLAEAKSAMGFRQPRIRPAQRSTEGALEPLACHLAFPRRWWG